jgi:hypothetical protein
VRVRSAATPTAAATGWRTQSAKVGRRSSGCRARCQRHETLEFAARAVRTGHALFTAHQLLELCAAPGATVIVDRHAGASPPDRHLVKTAVAPPPHSGSPATSRVPYGLRADSLLPSQKPRLTLNRAAFRTRFRRGTEGAGNCATSGALPARPKWRRPRCRVEECCRARGEPHRRYVHHLLWGVAWSSC